MRFIMSLPGMLTRQMPLFVRRVHSLGWIPQQSRDGVRPLLARGVTKDGGLGASLVTGEIGTA